MTSTRSSSLLAAALVATGALPAMTHAQAAAPAPAAAIAVPPTAYITRSLADGVKVYAPRDIDVLRGGYPNVEAIPLGRFDYGTPLLRVAP